MSEQWRIASVLIESGQSFVVVTLVAFRGHVPCDLGGKAIVTQQGLQWGTIGGGKVEARAIEHAMAMMKEDKRELELLKWNLTTDIGMTCGGEATFLFEPHGARRWSVVVFGAGHVGQAMVRTLMNLDCRLICVDARSEWLAKLPADERIQKIQVADLPEVVEKLPGDAFFVVMTKGHATDLPVLRKIYETHPEAPYVGVMGSDVKALKLRNDLIEMGVSEAQVRRLHSPIGLQLGGNAPFEIAISVAAELLQVRGIWEERRKVKK